MPLIICKAAIKKTACDFSFNDERIAEYQDGNQWQLTFVVRLADLLLALH